MFFFLLYIPVVFSFFRSTSWKTSRISMKQYEYAKEYFDFYNTFKSPILQQSQNVNYQHFARHNEGSYKIFEKNYLFIQSENEKLKDDIIYF